LVALFIFKIQVAPVKYLPNYAPFLNLFEKIRSKVQINKINSMKKLVMAILLMAGISGVAQDKEMRGKREAIKNFTPEQVATLQTKRMTLVLDLNESQQAKMKSMLTVDATTRKAKMEALEARKEEGGKMTPDEKFTMQNERLDHKIARKNEMKSLLTENQYTKWEKMNHARRMHYKGKREGRSKGMHPKRS
jgi:hypothetical protein